MELVCKKCDVIVGYGASGVVTRPDKPEPWLESHCWVCGRSREEVARNPRDIRESVVRAVATGPDGTKLGEWTTFEDGRHEVVDDVSGESRERRDEVRTPIDALISESASTEVVRYVDGAMFDAEPVEQQALDHPRVYLLSATPDPLGAVAAYSMMYEGRVIRDLAEITDAERRHYFDECFKTALKTPLEAIDLHFMIEGMTRATFDQMRTQRTASFAGESLRFAVKDTFAESVRPGPIVQGDKGRMEIWSNALAQLEDAYHALIGAGTPAEDARGLLPMNILTRAHWKSNLRNLEAEIGKRLCTQAQFEWRMLHASLRQAVREHGALDLYRTADCPKSDGEGVNWQWRYIAESPMFVPICFQKGACMFKASMDRGCTIRGRVDTGKFGEIKPEEWLMDPTAAWVK